MVCSLGHKQLQAQAAILLLHASRVQPQRCTLGVMLPCTPVQGILPEKTYQSAKILALTVGTGGVAVAITLMVGYVAASPTFGWTGGPPQSQVLT